MGIPQGLKFSEEHIWVKLEGNVARLGLTDFLQEELGSIVFAELPQAGDEIRVGDAFGSVESVKSVTELYSPISGTVLEVNRAVVDMPGKINLDPYASWMVAIRLSDPSEADKLWEAGRYAEAFGAR